MTALATFASTLASVFAVAVTVMALRGIRGEVLEARRRRLGLAFLVLLQLGLVSLVASVIGLTSVTVRPFALGAGASLVFGSGYLVTVLMATLRPGT